ncbi:high affinity immunoglobulin gamma Fc receptor I-like [Rana temporaria]|uniref:high affinity immunoglobulin gamma Fc receptor I-like n=1 Tax=Rana temporaria TaxID=8407 RepID=UPI001AAD2B94|nr:high affinity immunoglobulin gamma Fc receptor I-like [Rana temporaria]
MRSREQKKLPPPPSLNRHSVSLAEGTMSTLVLLFLVYICASGARNKPFVTFTPNWNKIFQHEAITIKCNMESTETMNEKYKWYKNDVQQSPRHQSIYIGSALLQNSGRYRCQIDDSERSDPVSLIVKNEGVIMQAPNSVFEGESLHLRCHSAPGYNHENQNITFSKNGKILPTSDQNSNFYVGRVTADMTGRYRCEKKLGFTSDQIQSDETFIDVKKVFYSPEIKMPPYPTVEGDHVTLTCDTSLSPLKQMIELKFAFYRDGQNIQKFSSSDQYGVQSAQLEDSGNYSCEVKTSDDSITKSSKGIDLLIQSLFFMPKVNTTSYPITEDDNMTLICHTSLSPLRDKTELQFSFYRNDQIVQNFSKSYQYGVRFAQLEDSGNYFCEVKAPTSNVKKRSDVSTVAVQRRIEKQDGYKLQNVIRLVLSGLIIIALAVILSHYVKTS